MIPTVTEQKECKAAVEVTVTNTQDVKKKKSLALFPQLKDIHGLIGNKIKVASGEVSIESHSTITSTLHFEIENGQIWSEYNPKIYELTACLVDTEDTRENKSNEINQSNVIIDEYKTSFGFRTISTDGLKLLLNGKQIFLRGKHDALIFPLTGAFPTDLDSWLKVFSTAKEYGINHYRYHTCCPPEMAFEAADLLGIYLEPQINFWGTIYGVEDKEYTNEIEKEQNYLVDEGIRMLDVYGNHPSYCFMSLGNELWGNRKKLSEILTKLKAYDKRHLYTEGSNNFQFMPEILKEDDFYVGVRLSSDRLIRGSYAMCDAPQGFIQTDEPTTLHTYDEIIQPENSQNGTDSFSKHNESNANKPDEIEIQYETGVKKVKAVDTNGMLIPNVPIISHEVGQYAVFPNFNEIKKYTGALRARNFEVFKKRLEEKGMLDQAELFFKASGKLAVDCYKREIEAAEATNNLSGFQLLDIQDYSGQGTALVGVLDAFMESKGLISPNEWQNFCSDIVLLAEFKRYCIIAGEDFHAKLLIRNNSEQSLKGCNVQYSLSSKNGFKISKQIKITDDAFGLLTVGNISISVPLEKEPGAYVLKLELLPLHKFNSYSRTGIENSYELWAFNKDVDIVRNKINQQTGEISNGQTKMYIVSDKQNAETLLTAGERVLLVDDSMNQYVEGTYCTDFWCYPMFRSISESIKKPLPIGTMGLLINDEHPALKEFPSHFYSTPQWYKIITAAKDVILDDITSKTYRPIVQVIDNFERNHKLGILFEGKCNNGKLMVLSCNLNQIRGEVEVNQCITSIIKYMLSDEFNPKEALKLDEIYDNSVRTK